MKLECVRRNCLGRQKQLNGNQLIGIRHMRNNARKEARSYYCPDSIFVNQLIREIVITLNYPGNCSGLGLIAMQMKH